jgi:2-methylisocitrate lyase-like PEP mutase family enzyme
MTGGHRHNGDQRAVLNERCDVLRALHLPHLPLVLPNAWDVASAHAVDVAGFPVVATTSAGVAASLGYEDGQDAPAAEMFDAAARIARSVNLPVTVDAEAGYGMAPADLVDALRDAGAAGCNLEDTDHATGYLADADRHAEWLRAVRAAADARDYRLVINARADVFIGQEHQEDPELLVAAIVRARLYLAAGADCVYPILLHDAGVIRAFVDAVGAPVNILAVPAAPSIAELTELGVARISYGALIHRRTMQDLTAYLEGLQ